MNNNDILYIMYVLYNLHCFYYCILSVSQQFPMCEDLALEMTEGLIKTALQSHAYHYQPQPICEPMV